MDPPDFEAGAEGLLVEAHDKAEPPAPPAVDQPKELQFTPAGPALMPPRKLLITASQYVPTWSVAVVPNPGLLGMSDTMRSAMASMSERLSQSNRAAAGVIGRLGGIRTGMIFGRKIEAARLGVILDVSGSAQPFLAGAVDEIHKGFADATLILYPGCGLVAFDGKCEHTIRKYSTIPAKEIDAGAGYFTTPAYLVKALRIGEFAAMTRRTTVKDTLFVSWYAEKAPDGSSISIGPKLMFQTQVAFDDLLKRGVDAIYWFADFDDAVDPRVADRLSAELLNKHVRLHVHNFAGQEINPEVAAMAAKTGGTVNIDKPK